MSVTYQKLTEVDIATALSNDGYVIAEDGGELKRIPKSAFKGDTGAAGADGADGASSIDDTSIAANKLWSAQKVSGEINALKGVSTNPLASLKPDGGLCGIFDTITCIGDSLTAGVHEFNQDGTHDYIQMADYSYPAFLAKATGCTVNNYGYGGSTAITMLARLVETSWLNANKSDAYIIYLGTNDVKDKEVVTGSTADVNLTTPASTVTTTDIGAYGKIIQMIREQVPKAKIFIVSMCYFRNSSSQVTASNVKYQALAEYMDCYYIDLATYAAPTTAEKTAWKAANMTGGHYNTLGYKCFATWIMSYIDWIIRNNQPDFALTAFTRETYDYVTVSFTVQPQSVTVAAGSITETLTAEAEASNGAAMSYQWYSNTTNATGGTAISGATSASYTIPTSLSAGSYFYYCVASCTANSRTSAVATVTVSDSGGGSAEPTAIASYALSGTSGEAVPTIADSTGNGNSLVPAGSLTYGTGGYPYISSAGKMLSLASVNLNGATSYKLHFKFVAAADMPNNTRLFTLSDGTEASYMSISYAGTATGTSVLFEKGGAVVFANTQECQLLGILRRQTLRTFTVDVTVANDNVTIYASGTNSDGVSAEYTQSVGTISGFTAAVEGGLVIGNRSAGDRFITAELTEFSVMTAE